MDINGKQVAADVLERLKYEVKKLSYQPGLAFVLVGKDPASQAYVRMKQKRCGEIGFRSEKIELSGDITTRDLFQTIDQLNDDPEIDGILVQMPLPKQIDELSIICRIKPEKDVDGFHPFNIGRLVSGDLTGPIPCTPLGVWTLLDAYDIPTEGKEIVVVGRSNIVGRPLANLLSQKAPRANATVTLVHSRTQDMAKHCQRADILIAALGHPHTITPEMVKHGATVIDVGINRTDEGAIVGDVDYHRVAEKAAWITPVPGGVGPMTIAMLLQNTLECAKRLRP